MAGSLNKVTLIGRLGQDPEVREVGTSKVANFSIATDESYTDKSGNKVEKTEWHKIVMWNKAAENAQAFLKKGSLVYVEGKIETRSWENDSGEKRYTTEIKSFSFQMLDNKSDQITKSEYTKKTTNPNNNEAQKNDNNFNQSSLNNEYNSMASSNSNNSITKANDNEEEDDLPF